MCWCDPSKRTPICDTCPPEKKAGWPQYQAGDVDRLRNILIQVETLVDKSKHVQREINDLLTDQELKDAEQQNIGKE